MGKDADTKNTEQTGTFSVDSMTGEIPSVTRLLNRKTLKLERSSPPKSAPSPSALSESPAAVAPPPIPAEPSMAVAPPEIPESSSFEAEATVAEIHAPINLSSSTTTPGKTKREVDLPAQEGGLEIKLELQTSSAPYEVSGAEISLAQEAPAENILAKPESSLRLDLKRPVEKTAPKVQRAVRKAPSSPVELIPWDPQQLKTGLDPLGRGISILLQKGASSALFLAIDQPEGSQVPHFIATAVVTPQTKLPIWTGMKWDPTVLPDVWNYFIKAGQVEFAPPGTKTIQTSTRNVMRAAFGLGPSEWLLLIRVGPSNACRGVVAFVSGKSMTQELGEALPLITAPISLKN